MDDSIAQNLNALITPAATAFDPSSTSQRTQIPSNRVTNNNSCDVFKKSLLFPSWQARTEVLDYCDRIASSPDPDDPERTLRQAENQRDQERVVNERLDPYSGRFFPREARTQTLATLIRQEKEVENVVRSRTWAVVQERCGNSTQTWEEAIKTWKRL